MSKSKYEYDSLGRQTKWFHYNDDGNLDFWHEYEYFGKEKSLSKHNSFNADGSLQYGETWIRNTTDKVQYIFYNEDEVIDLWIEYLLDNNKDVIDIYYLVDSQ